MAALLGTMVVFPILLVGKIIHGAWKRSSQEKAYLATALGGADTPATLSFCSNDTTPHYVWLDLDLRSSGVLAVRLQVSVFSAGQTLHQQDDELSLDDDGDVSGLTHSGYGTVAMKISHRSTLQTSQYAAIQRVAVFTPIPGEPFEVCVSCTAHPRTTIARSRALVVPGPPPL